MRARADMTEGDGLAGLDAYLPEFYLADFGEHLLHHVVVADRGTAAGDDEVKVARAREQRAQRRRVVTHGAAIADVGPKLREQGQRREAVGFVNLSGL